MNNALQTIDWDLVQLQFEVLHESPVDLAEAYNVSVEAIHYAIDTRGWKQKPYSDVVESWKDLDTIENKTDGIIHALKQRNNIIQLLKIQNFNARYTQLEAKAISKISNLMDNIDDASKDAPSMIRELVNAVKDLKSLSAPDSTTKSTEEDDDQTKFEININAVATQDADKPAIQI
jgi:hypothetical protein